jgi:ABC-2 type transport system permease protein
MTTSVVAAARRNTRLYWLFLKAGYRSQTIYGFDSFLLLFAVVFLNVVDLALLGVLFHTFRSLGGWTFWQIVLLYSVYLAAMGIQNLFTLHLNRIEDYVRDGTLDQMLLRPAPPFIQMLGREFHLRNVIHHLGTGVVGIVIATVNLHFTWTAPSIGWLVLALISGAVLLAGIVLALCSLAFWTVRSHVFVYGTAQIQEIVQHYPAGLFGPWFLTLVSTVVPFAFINYYPVLAMVGHPAEITPHWLPYLTPAVAAAVFAIGVLIFRAGLRRYQSTGS